MAISYHCDGCDGKAEREDLTEIGPLERIYCSTCLPAVDEYTTARDELHTQLAAKWKAGLAKIRKAAKFENLPDA